MQGSLTCTPMSAGGRWFGVIIADRAPRRRAADGTAAAHAVAARQGRRAGGGRAQRDARARARAPARRPHRLRARPARGRGAAAVRRLAGAVRRGRPQRRHARALPGGDPVGARRAARRRCSGRWRARARPTGTTVAEEVARLGRAHRDLSVSLVEGADVDVPERLEPLAQSVLREAVRNAGKHADPTSIDVRLAQVDGALAARGRQRRRRRRAADARGRDGPAAGGVRGARAGRGGGVRPAGGGRWRVRLTVPLELEGA